MRKPMFQFVSTLLLLLLTTPAFAVKISDITRTSGDRNVQLTGLGLVIGLKGTGDGGRFSAAINPLAQMLARFNDKVNVRELTNAANVAVVMINASVPAGSQEGSKIDITVATIGAASSLKGGRLFTTPLSGPLGPVSLNAPQEAQLMDIIALAQGDVVLDDATVPTRGVIQHGAVLEQSIGVLDPSKTGMITLILNEPSSSWATSSIIAKVINEAAGNGETLAVAKAKNLVIVSIPPNERANPANFIAQIQNLPVLLQQTEARVIINEKTGTIVMTGDVEISPVVISHQGLTITTVNPPPTPRPQTPVVTEKRVVGLDTTNQGGAKLQELVDAMDLIRVPAADRIIIIKELYNTGKLHAKLKIEGQNE